MFVRLCPLICVCPPTNTNDLFEQETLHVQDEVILKTTFLDMFLITIEQPVKCNVSLVLLMWEPTYVPRYPGYKFKHIISSSTSFSLSLVAAGVDAKSSPKLSLEDLVNLVEKLEFWLKDMEKTTKYEND